MSDEHPKMALKLNTGILRALGLHGMESIEEPVLASFVTGDPILLIGMHGTAKTTLAENIATAIGEAFIAYDASKALFEDVLGFPDVGSISSGAIQYIPTELSIWGKSFVLIDEISRAAPSMQNKWLEIIRSRRIMGLKLPELRYVLAAMNPLTYDGAYPLDPALAGRFTFIVLMPEACDMASDDVLAIIRSRNNGDAPALPRLFSDAGEKAAGALLVELLKNAREQFPVMENSVGHDLASFLLRFNYSLAQKNRELALDGRRLGLMYRGMLSVLALRSARSGGTLDGDTHRSLPFLTSLVNWMLPYPAMAGPAPTVQAIESAILWALQQRKDPQRDAYADSCIQLTRQFLSGEKLAPTAVAEWVRMTLEDLGSPGLDRRVDAAVSLACLASLEGGELDESVPASWRARLIRTWRLWTRITPGILADGDLLEAVQKGPLAGPNEGSQSDHLAFLLALHVSQDPDTEAAKHSDIYPDRVRGAYKAIRLRLEELSELVGSSYTKEGALPSRK